MRETQADTTRAIVWAIVLHVVLFGLMFAGLFWTRSSAPLSAAGPIIEADLIDPDALSPAMKRALRERPEPVPPDEVAPEPEPQPEPVEEEAAPPPQPLPEPMPEDADVPPQQQAQAVVPIPDTEDQDRVDRDALAAETREREQEEKRRQEQLDLTERQRQEEAEQKQRLARQQKDEALKKIREEMARAERAAALSEARLKQLADRRAQQAAASAASSAASPPPGNEGPDANLQARYAAALQAAIERNWTRPENIPDGALCRLTIRQLPGGEVMDVQVSPSCPYDELGRRSVEAAVLKAQPLPYAGFEPVFSRTLFLNFRPQAR